MDNATESVRWNVSIYNPPNNTADPGEYKVCFAETSDGPYVAIPSAETLVWTVSKEEDDSNEVPAVYTRQRLSGAVGTSLPLALAGHRLWPSRSKALVLPSGACGDNTVSMANTGTVLASSTASEYLFNVDLSSGEITEPGTYPVCFCDELADETLTADAGARSYQVTADYACTSLPLSPQAAAGAALSTVAVAEEFQGDFCAPKCAAGCAQHGCFCDAFDTATMYSDVSVTDADVMAPLCLSPAKCREACDATATCTGFDSDPGRSLCWLYGDHESCHPLTASDGVVSWNATDVLAACATGSDFAHVGDVTLTRRASVANDWVLTPDEMQGLELTGVDLDFHRDRIMIIEGTGLCGVSGPASAVSSPTSFRTWVARHDSEDPPLDEDEPGYEAPAATGSDPDTTRWTYEEGRYCAGNDMDVSSIEEFNVNLHRCHAKCVAAAPCDTTERDDCFCAGLFQGYDGEDSAALCLAAEQCKDVCASLGDCFGVVLHQELPRCFLKRSSQQPGSCEAQVSALPPSAHGQALPADPSYSFAYKTPMSPVVEADRSTMEDDQAYSFDQVLRFDSLRLTAGYYKACFCDFETLNRSDAVCTGLEDYRVEVGAVHVSGVSCLLEETKLQRGVCVKQDCPRDSCGLRCYSGSAPVLTPPTPPPSPFTHLQNETEAPTPAPTPDSTGCDDGLEECI